MSGSMPISRLWSLPPFRWGRRDFPTEKDIGNAKNCLTEERLFLDDRFGQYSQVIRQPFFSGVPEYGEPESGAGNAGGSESDPGVQKNWKESEKGVS